MSSISDILGPAARAARLRAGLTQAALARDCALSRQTIAQFEAGTYSDLGVRKIERVLARLGLRLEMAGDTGGTGGTFAPARAGSRIARLLRARGLARAREARTLAETTLRRLRKAGVSARIVGSLAKGTFRADSDVDYLIEDRGGLPESRVSILIEAAHSASITNSTATAYSAIMYRLGL